MPTDLTDLGRFTDVSLLLLLSLAAGPKHGYAIMEDVLAFSGTQLEPGTLYGALMRLERKQLIESLPANDRRRPYQIAPAGEALLREQLATLGRIVATGQTRLAASG